MRSRLDPRVWLVEGQGEEQEGGQEGGLGEGQGGGLAVEEGGGWEDNRMHQFSFTLILFLDLSVI